MTTPSEGYSGHKVCDIIGITYRQLDYWGRTDLIRPSLQDAEGSGSKRRYSYEDLVDLKLIKQMLDSGIELKKVRKIYDYIRNTLKDEVHEGTIVVDGKNVYFAKSSEEVVDLIHQGQGLLNVLPLGSVRADVDASIEALVHPDQVAKKPASGEVVPSSVTSML